MKRRRFFEMAAVASAAWLAQGCGGPDASGPASPVVPGTPGPMPARGGSAPILTPKVNGGINLHPVRRLEVGQIDGDLVILPELVALQLRAVYELGFDGIRLTASYGDRANFLATIPYVRAARALGIDVVVVLSNFAGFELARALWDERTRPNVLKLFDTLLATPPAPAAPGAGGGGPGGVGRVAFQILNEPALFIGVPPDVYVREILRPCYTELRRINPQIVVVAAGEVGGLEGPARIRAMIEAGLEQSADRIAFHIYDPAVIPLLAHDVRALVWVTESGAASTDRHLGWVRDVFPDIRSRIDDVSRLFFYVLYETTPHRFRLIDIQPYGSGFRTVRESTELYAYFAENVARAAGGAPLRAFETLIPDIRAYFPTPADIAAYDLVHFD